MGLFDDTSSSKRDEVRIGVSEREETRSEDNNEKRLKDDVEKKVGSTRSSTDSNVSMEDIHEQNERIIELLESLVDGNSRSGSSSKDIGDPDRISDRRSGNRNNDTDEDQGMRGGMDELL